MLVELVVENLAVVEHLRVRFHAGLNVLTGETGSGKSLVVDALGLLLGGRASATLIRSGAERLFISGIFELPADPALFAKLAEAGIEPEDGELLLEREVAATGKSRAYAASRPVTAAFLRSIAPHLGDIHGQHDQQRLFASDAQRELLDSALDEPSALSSASAAFSTWRSLNDELEELDRTEQEKLRLADLWQIQRAEIESLSPADGEDAELENESRVLKNVARLAEAAESAYSALSESELSASSQLGLALKKLDEAARYDSKLQALADLLRPAQISVSEAAHDLRAYIGHLHGNPGRLEEVESRLAQIEKLKRKYGATITEILAFHVALVERIEAVESTSARRAALKESIARAEAAYASAASALTSARRKSARKLEKQAEAELTSLAMKGTRFRIAITPSAPSAHGSDAIDFLVAANAGEEPRPLDKVASGGELSRIALALKTCLAGSSTPAGGTLVFDEVDSGVGGAAAEAVGLRLRRISRANQVLCVTHLPQIAGFADHHYLVTKRETKGRTQAGVAELTPEDRVREIGRMVSGQHLTDEAIRHAEKLIQQYADSAR